MKTSVFLSILFFFLVTGCEKKYDLGDISGFEFNYSSGSGETGYFYNFQLRETGVLDIKLRRPLSDSTYHSIYLIDNSDLVGFKPYLVELLNSNIKSNYYVEPGQSTDIPGIGINLKSNLKQVQTTISGAKESDLPGSLNRILGEVLALQTKYDTLVKL
jgi:hypothetical protein